MKQFKFILVFLLLMVLSIDLHAQVQVREATAAEAAAGVAGWPALMSPRRTAAVGGATNGQTATAIVWMDPTGSASGARGFVNRPFATLAQALAAARPFDKIVINPGSYFDGSGGISTLTNGLYVSARGATLTFSNSAAQTDTDVRLCSNCTIEGGNWNHISTTPGGVNGVIGMAAASGTGLAFTNAALIGVTINSDAACFKYSAPASETNISSCSFYDCVFNGTVTGFTSEGSASTIYNYIFNCAVNLTNTTTPANNRSGFKIRGGASGVYYIQNCAVTIADAGFSSFASAISTGHVPSGAGGFVVSNSFYCNGMMIDTTRCTNTLSRDLNVHCDNNTVIMNGCYRPDGARLTFSNYNSGLYPFKTNVYFTP